MKAELVEKIKALQRTSPDAKQAWWDYCDKELSGVRDPNRHTDEVLSTFLELMEQGAIPAAAAPPRGAPRGGGARGPPRGMGGPAVPMGRMGGGMGMGMGGMGMGTGMGMPMRADPTELAGFVKLGQRSSPEFKEAWTMYCQMYGGALNDPTRHDPQYIVGFMQYLGQLAMHDLSMQQHTYMQPPMMMGGMGGMGGGMGGMGRKRPMMDGGMPPAKKAMGRSGGKGAPDSNDPEKAALVDRIKALQRGDASTKEAWWAFTDNEHSGVHDPNRHSKEVLQEFLSQYE